MLSNSDIVRLCQSIFANCSLLVDKRGNPVPMCRSDVMTIVGRMEVACRRLDNANRVAYSEMWLEECADDVRQCASYYREQADNWMAETV